MNPEGGFFNNIGRQYGMELLHTTKELFTIHKKLAASTNRRIFLLRCRKSMIFPNHIKNNIKSINMLIGGEHPYKKTCSKIVQTLQRSVLNVEIKITIWNIKQLKQQIKILSTTLKENIDNQLYNNVTNHLQVHYNKHFNKIKTTNLKKFQNLASNTTNGNYLTYNSKNHDNQLNKNNEMDPNADHVLNRTNSPIMVNNFTQLQIPNDVIDILALGPKFSFNLDIKNFPIATVIKDLEFGINITDINDDQKNELRVRTVNIINNFLITSKYKKNVVDRETAIINRKFNKTKQFVKEHPEIIIGCSDKGNVTTIMYKNEYTNYVEQMLTDNDTYLTLKKDPTAQYQTEANNLIKYLQSKQMISKDTGTKLIKHNSTAPRLYCLRKTHKQGIKFRPIVSCNNSPSYNIAQYLHKLLVDTTTTFQYNIKNSTDLINDIHNTKLPYNYILISFYVSSLFTNVTKQSVLSVINKH